MIVDVAYSNIKNTNDRIYSLKLFNEIVKQFKSKKYSLYGYLGIENNMKKTSHVINNVFIKNEILYADITILNTKFGDILKNNIDDYSFALSGQGYIDINTNYVILEDYKFITISAILLKNDTFYKQKIRKIKLNNIIKNE